MDRILELFSLDGKLAVVSGGGGLIGSKTCEILAAAGANLVIIDVDDEKAKSIAAQVSSTYHGTVLPKVIDITNEHEVKACAQEVFETLGQCDILINAAHYKEAGFFHSLAEYPLETWNKVLAVNLTGTFLMCREFGSRMYEGNGGVIVNFSSTYGLVSPDPRIYGNSGLNSPIAYAATKSGIINMTRYMAVHWRPKVRANVLAPGGVEAGQDPEFIKKYEDRTPLERMAHPEDYQGTLLYLVSPASEYMTGAVVTVDGGWTAW